MRFLFFDTETAGLAYDSELNTPTPRLVSIAAVLTDEHNQKYKELYALVSVDFKIPANAVAIHGVNNEMAEKDGLPLDDVLGQFAVMACEADCVIGHNVSFDLSVIDGEYDRMGQRQPWKPTRRTICTMYSAAPFFGYRHYGPRLGVLYSSLFGHDFDNAHNALADVEATRRCFWEMVESKMIVI